MTIKQYTSPEAFKMALEARLRAASKTGGDFERKRQLLVFDRFLARVVAVVGDAAILKGGVALELRLERARATKDIDLRMIGAADAILPKLQEAARRNLADFLTYEISPDEDHPIIDSDGVQYEGRRFRAECRLAGKPYGRPFGVDVALGDPMIGEPDIVDGENVLDFLGVPPPRVRLYPIETHLAEKLHAYTLPRLRPNTRVKDLPDIALLAGSAALQASRVRSALDQTFAFRGTHPLPAAFPPPPPSWGPSYAAMAADDELPWADIETLTSVASAFLDPILGGAAAGTWNPSTWRWSSSP